MVRFLRMGTLVGMLAVGVVLMGCEVFGVAGAKEDPTTFPAATTISVRAKSIGMPSSQYVERLYTVKKAALNEKYARLIEAAPENQVRKYTLLLSQGLEFLELNYQERRRQLLEWES